VPFAYAEYLIQTACQKSCEPKRDLFRSVITTEAKFIAFRCTDAKCIGVSQYAISTRRIIHAGTVRKALGCKGKMNQAQTLFESEQACTVTQLLTFSGANVAKLFLPYF